MFWVNLRFIESFAIFIRGELLKILKKITNRFQMYVIDINNAIPQNGEIRTHQKRGE